MAFYYYPENYQPYLSLTETEKAILDIKDFFQTYLSAQLKLRRVTAPLYLKEGTGLNDDLNGIEKPVKFKPKNLDENVEIVQSLAKWKRMMLADYGIEKGYGLYTDMNAIRPDEQPDNLHSLYVDQWDWELVMDEVDRNLNFLKNIVEKIYSTLVATEFLVYESYPQIKPILPDKITFIHSQQLLDLYPDKAPFERENLVAKKYGAVFIIGIGANLSDGNPHDGRAPDYDDWITKNEDGYYGLNGDIIVWHPMINRALELSSMGIRVNKDSLIKQLEIRNCLERKNLLFHRRLLNGDLPQTIGGGIGQSRLCMFFLRKVHIGEVQASVWTDEIMENCRKANIKLM
ncbi:MAG: aspartate--ammonia ligase [Exilispira sp.]